jgi:N-acetylglutamate synthase-like GNAT family acetyltransferase
MPGSISPIETDKSAICRGILRALPDWFGLPDAIENYARAVEHLPMWRCAADGEIVGFLALKIHTEAAAEAYVLGVRRDWHRRGVGRCLFAAAEAHCRAAGLNYLTVKTLAPSRPDPLYARTRAFYAALGFVPLEVLPEVWGEGNPCLLMVKRIDTGAG